MWNKLPSNTKFDSTLKSFRERFAPSIGTLVVEKYYIVEAAGYSANNLRFIIRGFNEFLFYTSLRFTVMFYAVILHSFNYVCVGNCDHL